MIIKYLPTKPSPKRCFFLGGWVLAIYLLEISPVSNFIGSQIFNHLLRPILWMGLVFIILLLPWVRPHGKLKLKNSINLWAFNFAIIFIIASVMAGLVNGFGKSPYSHSIKGILLNIFMVGSTIVGREIFRCYFVNSVTKEENYLIFVGTALFMTITNISISKFTALKEYVDIVKFIAQYLAPEFAQNLLAVYLAFLGGPVSSIIYIGTLQGFHWLSPILPNLEWITTALIGVLCPAFSLIGMQNIYLNESKALKKTDQDEESLLSWMITCILSIGIIWFTVGVFPIYPSVIATGSMEPMIKPGDVILVRKVDGNLVGINDVIQFRRDTILISHRVMDIIEDEEGKHYRTKGDNNSGDDSELVKPEQVKGKIIYVVPQIGWPTLLIKSKNDIPLEEVVF